eukprot:CAMPEP_0115360038 /NCGR_PEP_ID=MMETSP0270-20121206/101481_1 /TAXON_ID=71861 /ORGANISM="Scrippsiella trochoidea, Strain CCMP3099" /LENGTH=49 /DNA_ID= /DNA_START= /DNA_END= /DNA_ORIENTATION=
MKFLSAALLDLCCGCFARGGTPTAGSSCDLCAPTPGSRSCEPESGVGHL